MSDPHTNRPWPPQDAEPAVDPYAVLEVHEYYEPDLRELGDMDAFYDEDFDRRGGADGTPGGALLDIARNNPVGTALAAAGIALMLAPRIEREDAKRAYDRARARVRSNGAHRSTAAGGKAHLQDRLRDARHRVEDWGERIEERFDALRDRIDAGTEELGEEARQRVVAARQRAIEARDRANAAAREARRRADRAMHDGAAQARDNFREHPLLAGALALGVGAMIGAALPRSRVEDERLGDLSHRLMDEAEAIYRRERARLEGAARGALHEGREMAAETAQSVREHVPDGKEAVDEAQRRLREGASRVAEGARRGMDEQ
ncbi:hypothetical protein [Rhodosalinus sp.]|uniref:hypothetical protein n=1 Tax=Rhodosalinus sp. TaxID=2047741 RepID=UPI00397D6785